MKKFISGFVAFILTASVAMAVSVHGADKNAYQQKTFNLQGDAITFVGANAISGGSIKLYDLPEGHLLIHGVVMDVLVTSTQLASVAQTTAVTFGVGTSSNVVGTGAFAATETNLSFATLAVYSSGVTRAQSQLSTDLRIDGSATAADVYLNMYTTNSLSTNAAAATVVGNVTVTYSILGDD